jgi:AcrR family transcriptional regulator
MKKRNPGERQARARILQAAEELFAARGYAGTSIRDITSKAGVNGAMVHYYFGSKEGLYRALIENAMATVRALIEEAIEGASSSKERLTRFVEAYSSHIFHHPNLVRIMNRELLSGGSRVKAFARSISATNYAMLRRTIAEGIKRGELRKVDLDLAPISLVGMILFFQIAQPIIATAIRGDKYSERFIRRLSAHTIDLFLNGAGRPHKCYTLAKCYTLRRPRIRATGALRGSRRRSR